MVIGGYKERSQHKNKYDYSGKPSKVMAAVSHRESGAVA